MTASLDAVAGDECVCPCHRDPSIHHVMACCADCEHCGTKVITPALPTHRPGRCGGFRSGRLAVQADAVVCVLVGLALVVLGFVHTVMPAVLQVVLGVLIAGWGIGLWLAPRRWPLRAVLTVVIAVNLLVVIALFIVGAGDARYHAPAASIRCGDGRCRVRALGTSGATQDAGGRRFGLTSRWTAVHRCRR